jgi:hypothetical protein
MVFMDYELNMSVFLLKILSKMAHFYQRKNLSSERNVFHHGLVKILIEFQLEQNGDSWEKFVKINHFQENSEADLQSHFSEVETPNPVEDIIFPYPQVSTPQQNTARVTRSQTVKFSLSPESCVFSEAPQVSSEASKQTIVSSLASECDPPVTKKNDDSISLVDFMNKRQGRKISRMFRNKSRKTSKASSPIQVEDEELVTNQEVSSPQHISPQEPIEKSLKKKRRRKLKPIPIWRFPSGRTNIIQWFQCYRKI